MAEFHIADELIGHEGAVRAMAVTENNMLVSGAMDSVVKCWVQDPGSPRGAYIALEAAAIYDHEHWVTAVARLPPNVVAECPLGGFVTGSMDKNIRVYSLDGQRQAVLAGHEGGVISLGFTAAGQLLSGSWDGTARVWDLATKTCIHVLPDHENGVCVLGLPDGTIVTGSTGRQVENTVADFKLRFWTNLTLTKTLTDHNGPIRQLALVPDIGFVSCSNDGSIKLRTLNGEVLQSMEHPLNREGKPGFVLGVTVLTGGRIVSASEDCTARVWNQDGSLVQSIEHPSGLWCVTALPNGDFVTGCDDKVARIFTSSPERTNADARVSLERAVEEARLVRERGPSGVEIEKLPDYDHRITVIGKSDGQVQMFRRNNKAWACQSNGPSKTWIDIGEVTGTGSGGVVNGKACDMVIPVEIERPGGVAKLEIGYNQGENPFMVAQEFINEHMLDQSYLKEIADYITQRAGEYRAPIIGDQADFGSGAQASAEVNAQYKHFPVGCYNTFETTKISKLIATLRQLNAKLGEAGQQEVQLSEKDIATLEKTAATVQDTAFLHSSTFSEIEIQTLHRLIRQWPSESVFPALDLARLVLVHPQGPHMWGSVQMVELVPRLLELGLGQNATAATRMLSLRVIANMFFHQESRSVIVQHKAQILSSLSSFLPYAQKTVALSLATVLLNFARLSVEQPSDMSVSEAVTVGATSISLLTSAPSLTELGDDTVLRALIAIGTLALLKGQEVAVIETAALDVFLATHGSTIQSAVVSECVSELQQLLAKNVA
ncbi:TPA: hypothetical protein N0F65_004256 [Lagenidium giganteum]|uniref:Phospholipase A-2-activating protein n=1 Tax=Lagenidium giganteum TaxID=4803 RepID=A0AAV2ZAZ9_9STRA|nr:TPA: hypothetical protein N0F65_004256 [Lagenidium giganteum]